MRVVRCLPGRVLRGAHLLPSRLLKAGRAPGGKWTGLGIKQALNPMGSGERETVGDRSEPRQTLGCFSHGLVNFKAKSC